MVYAQILAGGNGSRMGNTEMPKQFLLLGSKPIIIHTIEQMLLNSNIKKVIVSVPQQWIPHTNDIIKKYIGEGLDLDVIEGGNTRNETILKGCKHILSTYKVTDEDVIITHDAVRPFITQRIIDDNIEYVRKYDVVDTVVPAVDTIVEAKDGQFISDIPIRDNMYQGQTPQSFNIKKFVELYNELTDEEKKVLSDACKIFIIKGYKVKIVLGEVSNIKITTLYDLKIANAILKGTDKND